MVIGTSKGGLEALGVLLQELPHDFPLPVAIVQHRGHESPELLQQVLQRKTPLPVIEVEDKEGIVPGKICLAPANYHLLIENGNFALSTEAPVWNARPSIDLLFESAAETYGTGVIGVILTGANQDGAEGALRIKNRGGLVVVQDPTTAECATMPESAIAVSRPDKILALREIAPFLIKTCLREVGEQHGAYSSRG